MRYKDSGCLKYILLCISTKAKPSRPLLVFDVRFICLISFYVHFICLVFCTVNVFFLQKLFFPPTKMAMKYSEFLKLCFSHFQAQMSGC